jgi:WD40 repeat protein
MFPLRAGSMRARHHDTSKQALAKIQRSIFPLRNCPLTTLYSQVCRWQDEDGTEIEAAKATTLSGHESEVFTVAWNPVKSLLASGSGDSSARIWHIPTTESGVEAERNIQWHVLEHFNAASNEKAKDVTTLDWNSDGSLLATGRPRSPFLFAC